MPSTSSRRAIGRPPGDPAQEPGMTPPLRFLWRMLGFLGVVALVAALFSPQLASAFATNLVLNSLLLGVLLIGIIWNLRQVLVLRPEVNSRANSRSVSGGG